MEKRRIKPESRKGDWQRGCTTEIIYPGSANPEADSMPGAIIRIERTCSMPGHVASMHQRRNEEILTCVRSGTLLHVDSIGHEEKLWHGKLMLLSAGTTLYHEERTLGRDPVNGFHIHFRPERDGLEPMVQFREVGAPRLNEWRILAARCGAPLRLRSRALVHDGRFGAGEHHVPTRESRDRGPILIVLDGKVGLGGEQFRRGDIFALAERDQVFHVADVADLLLINEVTVERLASDALLF